MDIKLEELLALLSVPAFAVRDGEVAACNAAALGLAVRPGQDVASILGDQASAYADYTGGLLALRLPMGEVTVHRLGCYDLFLTEPPAQMAMERLAYLSQTLRGPLDELFSSAKWLFPFLEPDEDPAIQHCTARMNRALYRLLRMAGALTDVERLGREDAALDLTRCDLSAMLEALYDETAPLCEAAELHLELQCPARPHYALVDRQQLERAIYNLLSNAMRWSHPGGKILLRLDVSGSVARITVQDEGEGIPASLLPTAFDRLRQREPVGDARWGLGLGLKLARQIAMRHGGTVMLQSTEGEGTTAILSVRTDGETQKPALHTPQIRYDYAGGHRHSLTELSDALPPEVFDTRNLD